MSCLNEIGALFYFCLLFNKAPCFRVGLISADWKKTLAKTSHLKRYWRKSHAKCCGSYVLNITNGKCCPIALFLQSMKQPDRYVCRYPSSAFTCYSWLGKLLDWFVLEKTTQEVWEFGLSRGIEGISSEFSRECWS